MVISPIGHSDNKVILLLPKYRSQLKRGLPVNKTIHVWNEKTSETLRLCFELTDWDWFFNDSGFNPLTDVITSYISFCEDIVTPAKQITIHPNNNPWVTKNMKMCLGKMAFGR